MGILNRFRLISSVTLTLLVLGGVVRAEDENFGTPDWGSIERKFGALDSQASADDREKLKDFIVTPDNSKFSEKTAYTLEFSVTSRTFFEIVDGYLVFFFPDGFGLSELEAASIETDFGFILLLVSDVKTEGRFAILNYDAIISDTLWDSTVVPERVNFEIKLFDVKNPRRTGKYRISGAAITDHRFVAGPTWSEKFEITEESSETKAVVQIISTELVAPNSPKVNTNQEFSIEVSVANVSNRSANNVTVELMSDGGSIFEPQKTIEKIEGNDTVKVVFELTAAAESGTENFESDIVSTNVIELEAVDDTAGAIIQTPANLVLTSNIMDGDTIQVSKGERVDFSFTVTNEGQSSISGGKFQLDERDFISSIQEGFTVTISFTTPPFEIVQTHSIKIIEIPLDMNTQQPAPISDTEIQFTVVVDVEGVTDFEHSFIVENNPFNPTRGPVTFVYNLSGASDVEFNIFTVTGEEVYSKTYLSGTEGGKAGTNQIQWDGRNSNRDIVLNGVYVTTLNVLATGEKASLKLAVLK